MAPRVLRRRAPIDFVALLDVTALTQWRLLECLAVGVPRAGAAVTQVLHVDGLPLLEPNAVIVVAHHGTALCAPQAGVDVFAITQLAFPKDLLELLAHVDKLIDLS